MKLFDSEWKVMEVLWRENDLTAKEISVRLAQSIGWNKNTTYTVLKKCIDKGAIERREPNFVCHAAITKAGAEGGGRFAGRQGIRRLGGAAVCVDFERPLALQGGGRAAEGAGGGVRGMNGIQAAVLGGSALILFVFVLRLTLRQHLPRRLLPALWCAAAVRLLLPVSIPTRLSIWNLLRGAQTASAELAQTVVPFPALAQDAEREAVQTADTGMVSPVLLIWLTVAVLLAAYFGVGYAVMVRRLRGERFAPQPSIDALLDRFGFRRDPRICATKSRRAPLTFGVVHPTVLLPEDMEAGDAQFQLVLAHELAHIRRRDCLRKALFAACCCICWWNPLVWLMTVLANRDMELACDEAVLRALGSECKKAYALTLLDMAQRRPVSAPLSSGFARSRAEERIRAIMSFRRIPVWTGLCAAVLFALSAGALATQASNPVHTPERQSEIQTVENLSPERSVPEPDVRYIEAEIVPFAAEAPKYVWPLEDANAEVTDTYGMRLHPLTGTESFHPGVDLDAESGENVLAAADGTVLDCSYNEAYGYILTLGHADGVQTQYAHLREFLVSPGDTVAQGQVIALAGATGWATGPHLHLSVIVNGEFVDPFTALQS